MTNQKQKPEVDLIPPSFKYLIDWATPEEKSSVLERMRSLGRQTMNFRTMPTAKMIVLKDVENGGKIVGWQGLDYQHNPNFPETFSLFLEDAYRTFLLGVALSHSCASILQNQGVKTAFLRMEQATNGLLLKLRLESGIYHVIEKEDLNQQWVSQCQKCELYHKSCESQAYLSYDIDALVEFGNRRLGIVKPNSFPQQLILKPEILRQANRETKRYQAKWAA